MIDAVIIQRYIQLLIFLGSSVKRAPAILGPTKALTQDTAFDRPKIVPANCGAMSWKLVNHPGKNADPIELQRVKVTRVRIN